MKSGDYRPSDLLRGPAIPEALLKALPKTDLHCHLDGSLRMSTFKELGRAAGMDVPEDDAAVRDRFFPRERECVMDEFLRYFEHTLVLLQTPENLERVAHELATDFFAEGVWYLEVRFCPLFHLEKGLTADQAVAAVHAGLARAEKECGIKSGIILTGIRTTAPESSYLLSQLAVSWKGRGVVAFDLAGVEENFPARDHLEAFYNTMNNNQNVTIHAGEGFGPESIHDALHRCGANRIGHGTRLEEDHDLLTYVADHRIPLEVCLSSNRQSCVVEDLARHPFRSYLQKGLRVTLNTDNTLFADTSPLRELKLAVETFDLTLLETENLLINGFKSAFMPEAQKKSMIKEVLATMTSLRDKFALDDLKGASS
nr:adenosine deaminase [Candidatus Krumholzibacteria bacterium]